MPPLVNEKPVEAQPFSISQSIMNNDAMGDSFEAPADSMEIIYPQIELDQPALNDKQFSQFEDEVKSLEKSQVLTRNPKQIYNDKVMQLKSEPLKSGLQTLYEFGFVDFEINKAVLEANKYSIEASIQNLCE